MWDGRGQSCCGRPLKLRVAVEFSSEAFSSSLFVFQCSVPTSGFSSFQRVPGTAGLSPLCHQQPSPASAALKSREIRMLLLRARLS